jgi:hypothetical protein
MEFSEINAQRYISHTNIFLSCDSVSALGLLLCRYVCSAGSYKQEHKTVAVEYMFESVL